MNGPIYWGDGDWHTQMDDGVFITYSEYEALVGCGGSDGHDEALGKSCPRPNANFEGSRENFQRGTARHVPEGQGARLLPTFILQRKKEKEIQEGLKCTHFESHGDDGYLRKGGKGGFRPEGAANPTAKPGYTGCFICGDLQHDYRSCPKRSQPAGSSRAAGSLNFVEEVPEDEHHEPPSDAADSDYDPFARQSRWRKSCGTCVRC